MPSPSQENEAHRTEIDTIHEASLDSLPIPICHLLPDGTLTFFNQAFTHHFKEEPQNLIGGNFLQIFSNEPRTMIENNILDLSATNPIISSLVSYNTRDQVTHWERWTLQGIFDSADKLVEVKALGYDLDIRGLSVSAASQYAQQLSSLNTASQILLSNLDLEASLGQILDAAVNAIPGGEKGALYLVKHSTGDLEIQNIIESIHNDPRIQPFDYPGDSGSITRVLRNRSPIRIDALQPIDIPPSRQDTLASSNLHTENSNSAIIAPLILGTQTLGAITIEATIKSAFTNSDLHLLQNFAALTTLAIYNFHLKANLDRMKTIDPLTKTYNRRGFQAMAEREIQRALRFNRPVSIILIDIDNFKQVNQKHGLTTGDRVLQSVSERICHNIRKIDIIGRYGGDEFILLLPETDLFGAATVAERLQARITNTPIQHEEVKLQVTACLGIVKFIAKQENLDSLIKRAEEALELAKQSGRNRVEIR